MLPYPNVINHYDIGNWMFFVEKPKNGTESTTKKKTAPPYENALFRHYIVCFFHDKSAAVVVLRGTLE